MKNYGISLATSAFLALFTSGLTHAQPIDLTAGDIGKILTNFEIMLTGGGPAPRWEIVADTSSRSGRALAQLSTDRTDNRFPLAVYQPILAANVQASVRFKAIAGRVDQAAGLAVRLMDANNYYIVRANALEDNVRFYRVVAGRRQELTGANLKVSSGEWHTLGLRAQGDRFTILFDGLERYSFVDKTFSGPGRVALWTKADSVTHFENFAVEPLP